MRERARANEFISRITLDQAFYAASLGDILEAPRYPSALFSAYWFDFGFLSKVAGFAEVMMALFTLQLVTLVSAFSSLFVKGRIVRLLTLLAGFGVAFLMLAVIMDGLTTPYHYAIGRTSLGFWMAASAEFVFTINLARYDPIAASRISDSLYWSHKISPLL